MKLKSTALKTGLLLLIGAGLIGCSVLGNYSDDGRIDYAVKIEFRDMSSFSSATPINDPNGWDSQIKITIRDLDGTNFNALAINASLFFDDYFDYWLREENGNIMSFLTFPFAPWYSNSEPLYIVLEDSENHIVYSNNQSDGEINIFGDYDETLTVRIYGSQISTNSNSWQ